MMQPLEADSIEVAGPMVFSLRISLPDLPDYLLTGTAELAASDALRDVTRRFERQHIMAVLAQTQFDKKEAARRLGISLASLYRKLLTLAKPRL